MPESLTTARDGRTDVDEIGELLAFELDKDGGTEAIRELLTRMLDGRIEGALIDEATAGSLTNALDEGTRIDD
jgi:hypothetical protein